MATHALSAEDAVAFQPRRPIERRQLEEMCARRILRELGNGTYWLDRDAYRAERARRMRPLIPIILILTLLAAAIPLFFYRG